MLPYDQQVEAMAGVRDELFRAMGEHEQKAHGGLPCWGNRCSAVAYLCHSLGVRGDWLDRVADLLREYDARCPGCPGDEGR